MVLVLFTRASKSYLVNSQFETYLELIEFNSLIEAIDHGLKQHYSIIIEDMKQQNDYDIYKEYIVDFGFKFQEYDYHITIYDDYIE